MNTHDVVLGALLACLMRYKVWEYTLAHEPRATAAAASYLRRAQEHRLTFFTEHRLSNAAWRF